MSTIDPVKLEELRLKYGIQTDDMEALAGSPDSQEIPEVVESETSLPPKEDPNQNLSFPITGNQGEMPSNLMKALSSGDSSMNDILGVVIVMDYLDRMEERRDQRKNPRGQGSDITRLLEEMKRDKADTDRKFTDMIGTFEKTLLGKERDEAIDRANRLQDSINARAEHDKLQSVVDSSVSKVVNYYEDQIEDLRAAIGSLPPNQQKGFMGDLFEELGEELRTDVRDQFLSRLRGEKPEGPLSTDEDGRTKIDYGKALNRTIDLLQTWIEKSGTRPPLKSVKTIKTEDNTQSFLDDGGVVLPPDSSVATLEESLEPEEPIEEIPEAVVEETVETVEPILRIHGGLEDRKLTRERSATKPSIPLEEITGIGPKTAEDLRTIGISNVNDLSGSNARVIIDNLEGIGLSEDKASDWIKQARERMEAE